MKIEYLPVSEEKSQGPRYFLRPQTHQEQKFLTILRDAIMGKPLRLRMIGTENSEKTIPDMPAQPVIAAAFCIEDLEGNVPPEFIPKPGDKLDVDRPIQRTEQAHVEAVAIAANNRMKVVKQSSPNGPSTVIEEK